MIEIIKELEFREEVTFTRDFFESSRLGGYSFPCNEAGEPLNLNPASLEAWAQCTAPIRIGRFAKLSDCGVTRHERDIREPAIGRCTCGREVILDAFTCPCDCGRDYNSSGQLLSPRSQWGEETGEHWTECY